MVTIASGNDIRCVPGPVEPYDFSDYFSASANVRPANERAGVGPAATATKTATLAPLVEPATVGRMLGEAAASIAADTGWSPNLVTLNRRRISHRHHQRHGIPIRRWRRGQT